MRMRLFIFLFFCSITVRSGSVEVQGPANIDFGTYSANERKTAVFILKNKGESPLNIVMIRKTCACSEVKTSKNKLEPEEETKIEIAVLPESIAGLYSKNIYVETDDPKNRFTALTVSGKALPLFTVKPSEKLYAGMLALGQIWKTSLLLESSGNAFEFGKIQVEGYPAKAELKKLGPGKFGIDVELKAEKAGMVNAIVRIPVLKPAGWKAREIVIFGKVGK
ncbi:MAG: hypothetical protein A2020_11125 [Lentisphaerae bacterium GWF2_45_14]|nr:MAG: hypothetical protein A2020_11125 [Lentisphaerae bacterium GWF2_45_14]